MSYASEPYSQFVDDLLTSLMGGVARQEFLFLLDQAPFRLFPPGPLVPSTLRVYGQVERSFYRFRPDVDFTLTADDSIVWQEAASGEPAPDAVWPDEGTRFFVNYEHRGPAGANPVLTDRNTGSVVRTLAESFAREYAVVSKQLERVYEAGFLDSASGRDLDQLVALVGVERLTRAHAIGTVVFSRTTPASADIVISAGTRLSAGAGSNVVFETTEKGTLFRGTLSAEVAVRAEVSGPSGVVAAQAIQVIHRPIFGIDSVSNPHPTRFASREETDEALRARARRAHELAGLATSGALVGALATLPGVREKDVRLSEDPVKSPGLLAINVAAPLEGQTALRAAALIEATRPAGVRVVSNLDIPRPLGEPPIPPNRIEDGAVDDIGSLASEGLYQPVCVRCLLLPAGPLSAAERKQLTTTATAAVQSFVAEAGIGEPLVYNRLIAELVVLEGVLDVMLELYPKSDAGAAPEPRRRNLLVPRTLRAQLAPEDLSVEIAGEIVAFDLQVSVALTDVAANLDPQAGTEIARMHVAATLQDQINALGGTLTRARLLEQVAIAPYYTVSSLSYRVEYVQASLVIGEADPPIELLELERAWVRTVRVTVEGGGSG